MTTYRELIYMCLDLLKGESDDFTYTEEHIAYLLDKYRALLLKQRYGNDPKKHVPYSNYQSVKVNFNPAAYEVNKSALTSTNNIPYTLQLGIPRIQYERDTYYTNNYEYVSRERFQFVGNNKYLKNISYFTIDNTNKVLLLNKDTYWRELSGTTVFNGPQVVILTAIFENPRSIQTSTTNHWMDNEFPLEESLVSTLIEMVVNSLIKIVTFPTDTINNGTDENSQMPSRMEVGKDV